ncbi:MAG: hypothetical protein JWP86_2475 [Phenylobacterium sp.]|nr:hypothetical protein [Phenylobacterium sp.]
MPLGSSALPPLGYVAFCERKPQDCGADARVVLAEVSRAKADRAELMAALGPSMPPVIMPAALGSPGPAHLTQASFIAAAPEEPRLVAPGVQEPVVAPAVIETRVEFIDPTVHVLKQADETTPHMTPKLWSLLNQVNGDVNGAIEERTDRVNYGVDDYWNTPLEEGRRAGDCEDYVLEKQRALLAAGLPRPAINIGLVTTRWGESHAVLLVATSEGEYVLDNLSPWIVAWRQAPYRWVRRQLNGDAFTWVMIEDPARLPNPGGGRLLIASAR